MCRVFEGASVCVGSGSRERWHRECGSAGVGGRDVASSRAVLEQQLSCGKAGGGCLMMQKEIKSTRQSDKAKTEETSRSEENRY